MGSPLRSTRPSGAVVRLSPLMLAAVLTPAFLNIDYSGCQAFGDSTLVELELIVEGENYISGFDSAERAYAAALPEGTGEARVRTVASDPDARISLVVFADGEPLTFGGERETHHDVGVGDSDFVVPLPAGSIVLQVWVAPYGGASDYYEVRLDNPPCIPGICIPWAQALEEYADEHIGNRIGPNDPGLAIALMGPEGLVFETTYGLANVAESTPVATDTPFMLASVSKPFAAIAAMILHEEGVLHPDDLVADHFAEAPDEWRQEGMTVHHLMTHSHGIPPAGLAGRARTNQQALEWAVAQPLARPPGEQLEYSNLGYTLTALLVERVSGQPFPEFMEERVFGPLGMVGSSVPGPLPDMPNRAIGYLRGAPTQVYLGNWGGTGQWSSLDDLKKWEQGLRDEALVSRETLDLILTPHIPRPDNGCSYGYGWNVCDLDTGLLTAYHTGGGPHGFRTIVERAPEEGVAVLMVSNGTYDWAPQAAYELYLYYLGY